VLESCWTDSTIASRPDTDGLWSLATNVDEGLTGFVPWWDLSVRGRRSGLAPTASLEAIQQEASRYVWSTARWASMGDEVITRRKIAACTPRAGNGSAMVSAGE